MKRRTFLAAPLAAAAVPVAAQVPAPLPPQFCDYTPKPDTEMYVWAWDRCGNVFMLNLQQKTFYKVDKPK